MVTKNPKIILFFEDKKAKKTTYFHYLWPCILQYMYRRCSSYPEQVPNMPEKNYTEAIAPSVFVNKKALYPKLTLDCITVNFLPMFEIEGCWLGFVLKEKNIIIAIKYK